MRNIKLVFSYDGSQFFGSQAQPNNKTVQDAIEHAIFRLTRKKARLTFAGRTDRGVHGSNQVANFLTDSSIPADRFAKALNAVCDKNINVKRAEEVGLEFNSRHDARTREYVYYVYSGEHVPLIFSGKVMRYRKPLNLRKMLKAAGYFIGRHNFKDLSAKGSERDSTIRTVFGLDIGYAGQDLLRLFKDKGKIYYFRIVADSYLYKMVRFIVAALLQVGSGSLKLSELKRIIKCEGKSMRQVVPPCGLYLNEVKY